MIRASNGLLLMSFSLLVQASSFASGIGTRGGAPPAPMPKEPEPAVEYECSVVLTVNGSNYYSAKTSFHGITPFSFTSKPSDWSVRHDGHDVDVATFPMGLEHHFEIAAVHNPVSWIHMGLTADWRFFSSQDQTQVMNTLYTTAGLDSVANLEVASESFISSSDTRWTTSVSCKNIASLRRFSPIQAKSIVDAIASAVPSKTGDWSLGAVACNRSQREIVGPPGGAPFSIRESNYCEFVVNSQKLVLEQANAKELFAALDIDWVRGRTSNRYSEVGLSLLSCTRRTNGMGVDMNSCAGRK